MSRNRQHIVNVSEALAHTHWKHPLFGRLLSAWQRGDQQIVLNSTQFSKLPEAAQKAA